MGYVVVVVVVNVKFPRYDDGLTRSVHYLLLFSVLWLADNGPAYLDYLDPLIT